MVMPSEPPAKPEKKKSDATDDDTVPARPDKPTRTEPPALKLPEPPASDDEDRPARKSSEKVDKPAKSKKSGKDDFDPADFLMGDGPKRPAPAFEDLGDPDADRPRSAPSATENRPKKPSKPAPEPAAAGGGGFNASSHAKEMMMKAMEESRLHAGDAPLQEEKEGFDYAGMFREIGLKGVLGVIVVVGVAYGMYMLFDRMIGGRLKLPPLAHVTGTVTLDGKPLKGATVYFAPLEPEMKDAKKERARTSFGITDDQGKYVMIYIEKTKGVAVGKCRVWLDLVGPNGQVIPPSYTEATMQVREIKPGSGNDFPFNMQSAP
jgi:hypothetical protein